MRFHDFIVSRFDLFVNVAGVVKTCRCLDFKLHGGNYGDGMLAF